MLWCAWWVLHSDRFIDILCRNVLFWLVQKFFSLCQQRFFLSIWFTQESPLKKAQSTTKGLDVIWNLFIQTTVVRVSLKLAYYNPKYRAYYISFRCYGFAFNLPDFSCIAFSLYSLMQCGSAWLYSNTCEPQNQAALFAFTLMWLVLMKTKATPSRQKVHWPMSVLAGPRTAVHTNNTAVRGPDKVVVGHLTFFVWVSWARGLIALNPISRYHWGWPVLVRDSSLLAGKK